MRSAERRHVASYHDCVPEKMSDGRQLPIACAKGGEVKILVGHADGRAAEVVVALDVDAPAPDVRLNGSDACGGPVRVAKASLFGHTPKAVWRVPFNAGVAADGYNVVSIAPAAESGARVVWCEIDL